MAIIVLVGKFAESIADRIPTALADIYDPVILRGHFQSVRSTLAVRQDAKKLFILPGLEKPDRYEIFCLARKHQEIFLTVVGKGEEESLAASDKNVIRLEETSDIFQRIKDALQVSKTKKNQANVRTKGLSLGSLSQLKDVMSAINARVLGKHPEAVAVVRECEEQVVRMHSRGLRFGDESDFTTEYEKIVTRRLEQKK